MIAFSPAGVYLLLIAVAFLATLIYLVRYFCAMAPRKGTFEWIAMVDKPDWCRSGVRWIGKKYWVLILAAAVCAGLSFLRGEEWKTVLYCAGSGLLMALSVALFTGNASAALCGACLLGAVGKAGREDLLILFSFYFLMLSCSDRKLWRRLGWLMLAFIACVISRVAFVEGEIFVFIPPIGSFPPVNLPVFSLLLGLPVCLIQALRLHRSAYLTAFLLLLLAPVNYFLGMPYAVSCCLILGFSALAGDACGRKAVLETFVITGVLMIALLVYQFSL